MPLNTHISIRDNIPWGSGTAVVLGTVLGDLHELLGDLHELLCCILDINEAQGLTCFE